MLAQGSKSGQGKLGHAAVAAQGRDVAIERTSRGNPDPGAPLSVPWGPRESILAVFFALLAFVSSQVLLVPFAKHDSGASPFSCTERVASQPIGLLVLALVMTLLWQIAIIGISHRLARRTGGGWFELGIRPFPKGGVRMVGGALAAMYVVTVTYGSLAKASGICIIQPHGQIPDQLFAHAGLVFLGFIAVVLSAPIAEEILFRGLVFSGFRKAWGFWPAAIVSGLLFSLAHVDPGLIVPFTLVGMILAYVYYRAGSIYASISIHFLFNCVSFLALLLIPGART
jgi:membrane protease YdiL (CAAX protease family)